MIVLDTHVWIWWVDGNSMLPPDYLALIQAEIVHGVGVCAISMWEVAKLVERGRLQLACPVEQWLGQASQAPIQMLPLTPAMVVASTQLPGSFHRDPADQLIVATARMLDCPLITMDRLIRAYPHVRIAP